MIMTKKKCIKIIAICVLAAAFIAVGCVISGDNPARFVKKLFLMDYMTGLDTGAGLLTVALFGFLSSFHCIGMCGGTILCLCTHDKPGRQSMLFHLGRCLTCTAVGAVLGFVGHFLYINTYLKALVPLLCAVFMLVMGLNMLGLFRWLRGVNTSHESCLLAKLQKHGALVMGILTGILPCGVLQVVQMHALESGDPVRGAAELLVFAAASTPVMFVFGLLSGKITVKGRKTAMTVAAILVIVLGVKMGVKALKLMAF